MAARKAAGLGEYRIAGYNQPYASYGALPQSRPSYEMSRYPHPMKKGEAMDWAAAVIPIVGADGERGVRSVAAR